MGAVARVGSGGIASVLEVTCTMVGRVKSRAASRASCVVVGVCCGVVCAAEVKPPCSMRDIPKWQTLRSKPLAPAAPSFLQFAFGGTAAAGGAAAAGASAGASRKRLYSGILSKLRALMIARMAKPEEVCLTTCSLCNRMASPGEVFAGYMWWSVLADASWSVR